MLLLGETATEVEVLLPIVHNAATSTTIVGRGRGRPANPLVVFSVSSVASAAATVMRLMRVSGRAAAALMSRETVISGVRHNLAHKEPKKKTGFNSLKIQFCPRICSRSTKIAEKVRPSKASRGTKKAVCMQFDNYLEWTESL